MGERKSILLLSATAGAGHRRAAEALAAAAKRFSPRLAVTHEDILDFTSPLFKKLYSEVYYTIADRSPDLWGYLYNTTDRGGKSPARSPLMKLFDHFNYQKYLRALRRLTPDAVLCTHFLPYAAITEELRKSSWNLPFFSVPTDYYVHTLWLDPSIRRYYVASEEARFLLEARGVAPDRIEVTGIPVMPEFTERTDPRTARRRLGLDEDAFTVMLLSGGYGIGVADELVASLSSFLASLPGRSFQLIVVCGKNPALYGSLRKLRHPKRVAVRLYQYVDYVDRLMDASDLLVTKSGGLTVSEALAKRLPMIIFHPFPGQEGRNAEYLFENGAALAAWSLPSLQYKLKQLIDRPARLVRMRANARAIAAPNAARLILTDLLKQLTKQGSV